MAIEYKNKVIDVSLGSYSGVVCVKPGSGNFIGDITVSTASADFPLYPKTLSASQGDVDTCGRIATASTT